MIAVGFIVVLEITFMTVRCLVPIDTVTAILSTYTILHVIIVIFYLFAAIRIFKSNISKDKKRIIKITKKIVYCAIATLGGVLCLALALTPLAYAGLGYSLIAGIAYISYFLQSLMLLLIFKPPIPKQSSSSSAGAVSMETSSVHNQDEQ